MVSSIKIGGVIEASACEIPVVVSDVGGLPEVVKDGITGFIVPSRDIEATADAIQKLIERPELAKKMGKAGREFVLQFYESQKTVKIMSDLYEKIFSRWV